MCRELTSWNLVVNSLFGAERPIRIEPDFWQYILFVSDKLKEEISKVEIRNDHYSIENVLWYEDPLIIKQGDNIRLNDKYRDESYFSDIVNRGLDEDIKNTLPSLVKKAYKTYAKNK